MAALPKIVLLTGDSRRHFYVAAELASRVNVVGVLHEKKAPIIAESQLQSDVDRAVIDEHMKGRDLAERKLLGDPLRLVNTPSIEVPHNESNSTTVFQWVKDLKPDFIVLYGTSIIRPPLLQEYDGRIVNLHLGLSPYYRGTATNFWPLVEREPECVGATIHLAVLKVDAGPILAQVRPKADVADRAHELGTKTIIAATQAIPRVLDLLGRRQLEARTQNLAGGRVYRRRDFNADAVRRMWRHFESGMMDEYIGNIAKRCAAFPIVELSLS